MTTESAAAVPEHVAVDVAELATWLQQELRGSSYDVQRRPSIWRVIPSVRREDSAAYDPHLISIGPFHRDNKALGPMEEQKRHYLRDLLRGCPEKSNLDDAFAQLSARVRDIRNEYSEEFEHITDKDFVKMMVLDGCFILQLMINLQAEKGGHHSSRSSLGGKWSLPRLVSDLLLLENQIPFFVLEILFQATAPHRSTLLELAYPLVKGLPRTPPKETLDVQILHLLHLHCYHQVSPYLKEPPPSRSPSRRSPLMPRSIPTVTILKKAGVRFKRREFTSEDSYSYLKVTFSPDGVFEIPFLMLHGNSYAEFRNLIAFEQSCNMHNIGNYVTSYCMLMSCLIRKESDVEILEENGIICNYMGNGSEMARLFVKVVKGACLEGLEISYYSELIAKMNRYCEVDSHRWRAMHDFFRNPWSIIFLLGGAKLLILTFLRTYYTILTFRRMMRMDDANPGPD